MYQWCVNQVTPHYRWDEDKTASLHLLRERETGERGRERWSCQETSVNVSNNWKIMCTAEAEFLNFTYSRWWTVVVFYFVGVGRGGWAQGWGLLSSGLDRLLLQSANQHESINQSIIQDHDMQYQKQVGDATGCKWPAKNEGCRPILSLDLYYSVQHWLMGVSSLSRCCAGVHNHTSVTVELENHNPQNQSENCISIHTWCLRAVGTVEEKRCLFFCLSPPLAFCIPCSVNKMSVYLLDSSKCFSLLVSDCFGDAARWCCCKLC